MSERKGFWTSIAGLKIWVQEVEIEPGPVRFPVMDEKGCFVRDAAGNFTYPVKKKMQKQERNWDKEAELETIIRASENGLRLF